MEFGPVIKNPVLDINKLVRQGTMLNQSVQTVEGDSTADQATTDLLAKKDPVIHEISVGISGEEASLYTVSGTPPLSLPNSLGKPLKAWSVDVVPKQDLNGYDAPWPAGGGVNKYDESTVTYSIWINQYGVLISNADYSCVSEKISVPASTAVGLKCYGSMAFSFAVAEYQSDDTFITRHYSDVNDLMFTTDSNCSYVKVAVARYFDNTLPITPEILAAYKVEFVIESSLPASFTPYSNICPISGTDKVNLFVEESYDPTATPKAVLTIPQTVYTGTIGSEGGESRSAELIADDSLNWSVSASNSTNIVFSVNVLPFGTAVEIGQISNMFVRNLDANVPSDSSRQNTFVLGVSGNLFVQVSIAEYPDVDTFKALLAVTPLHIVYPLATHTTFAVPTPTIPTPTGTATTWATAEDGTVDSMEVTYIKSE